MESTFKGQIFAQMGANSFLYEMTPIYMGGNNENDRVASLESVPIQHKHSVVHLVSRSKF